MSTHIDDVDDIKTAPSIMYKTGEGDQTLDGIILSRPLAKNILDRIAKYSTYSFVDGFMCGFLIGIATACVILHPRKMLTVV